MAPIYGAGHDDLGRSGPAPDPKEIVEIWIKTSPEGQASDNSGDFGFADEADGAAPAGAPGAAFNLGDLFSRENLDKLDPRNIVRAATVLQMKDRAGTVGAHGVGLLLQEVLAASPAAGQPRVHLVGHSYGAKVVLSALCFPPLSRNVNSVLLLEPAISYLSFAAQVPGTDHPGGYRDALKLTEQPILTTFSSADIPLTQLFHLGVRRASDIGDLKIAGAPPSVYAALGGYGPGGIDAERKVIPIKDPGDPYALGAGAPEVFALDGQGGRIKGHGDISNEYTWWALYSQIIS